MQNWHVTAASLTLFASATFHWGVHWRTVEHTMQSFAFSVCCFPELLTTAYLGTLRTRCLKAEANKTWSASRNPILGQWTGHCNACPVSKLSSPHDLARVRARAQCLFQESTVKICKVRWRQILFWSKGRREQLCILRLSVAPPSFFGASLWADLAG